MSQDWNYAELAKEAKHHGGPEAYLEDIREEGRLYGRNEILKPLLITLGAIGIVAITAGIFKFKNYIHKQKETQKKAKISSEILLKEINNEIST
ncbi:hypothetical protein RyT2_06800 [Pseudolactococcus yaeyamensis]